MSYYPRGPREIETWLCFGGRVRWQRVDNVSLLRVPKWHRDPWQILREGGHPGVVCETIFELRRYEWSKPDRYSLPWRGTDLIWIGYATQDSFDLAETLAVSALEREHCHWGVSYDRPWLHPEEIAKEAERRSVPK